MSRKKWSGFSRLFAAMFAGLLVIASAVALPSMANATEGTPPVCTPADAWSEEVLVTAAVPGTPEIPAVTENAYQRYSWTGGGEGPGDSTPLTNPADWQANTTNYEGAGHGSDPVGTAFKKGNGKGDWFFWTVTEVVVQEAVPATPETPAVYETVYHEPVVCPIDEPVDDTILYTAPAPTSSDVCEPAEGDSNDSITIPEYDTSKGSYTMGGEAVAPGTYPVGAATEVRVAFQFADGVEPSEGSFVSQTFTFSKVDCETTPPVEEPEEVALTLRDLRLVPWCFRGETAFDSIFIVDNANDVPIDGVFSLGTSENPTMFTYLRLPEAFPGNVASIAQSFATPPGDYTLSLYYNGELVGGPASVTVPADACGPVVPPIVVPEPMFNIGGGCIAPNGELSPFTFELTWNPVEGQTFALIYEFFMVNEDGSLGERIYRVFGDYLSDGDERAGEAVAYLQAEYDFAENQIAVTAHLIHNGTGAESDVVRADFVVTECETTPPPKPETPEPTTVTVYGNWVGGEPSCEAPSVTQTRSVSTVTTTYEVVWNAEAGKWEVVEHVGAPVAGTPETRTLTYEGDDCEVVTPPTEEPEPPVTEEPKPPVKEEPKPPVNNGGDHKTPTKVQTDGNTSGLLGLAGIAALAAVLAGAAAGRTLRHSK